MRIKYISKQIFWVATLFPRGGRVGALPEKFGGDVWFVSQNSYPIYSVWSKCVIFSTLQYVYDQTINLITYLSPLQLTQLPYEDNF